MAMIAAPPAAACAALSASSPRASPTGSACAIASIAATGGAPFGAFAIFPAERVSFSGDARRPPTSSSAHGCRRFCRSCGLPAFGRDEGSDEVEFAPGPVRRDRLGGSRPPTSFGRSAASPGCRRSRAVRRHERDRPGPQRSEP